MPTASTPAQGTGASACTSAWAAMQMLWRWHFKHMLPPKAMKKANA